jgi:hypothetical protein
MLFIIGETGTRRSWITLLRPLGKLRPPFTGTRKQALPLVLYFWRGGSVLGSTKNAASVAAVKVESPGTTRNSLY